MQSGMVVDIELGFPPIIILTARSLTDLTNMLFDTIIYLCYASSFNLHLWHVVAICTLEFLILRGLSQASLELRACVCLGYLS